MIVTFAELGISDKEENRFWGGNLIPGLLVSSAEKQSNNNKKMKLFDTVWSNDLVCWLHVMYPLSSYTRHSPFLLMASQR